MISLGIIWSWWFCHGWINVQ